MKGKRKPQPITPAVLARFRAIDQRKKAETPARRQEQRRQRHEENCRRLAEARRVMGARGLKLRWECRVRRGAGYHCILGRTVMMVVPEVIDAWDAIQDAERFLRAWRPMRVRTPAQQVEAEKVWEAWERLAAAIGSEGRWSA